MDLFRSPTPGASPAALLKRWTREIFGLPEDTVVVVTELHCAEPGCPPLETVIAILESPGVTRQYKLHKAMREISRQDMENLAR
ncbi:MAG: hypothetical protein J0L64_04775 [Acidobacteria bacterium]|nr:hypothetical protein [Acidobacteriota bacterium]